VQRDSHKSSPEPESLWTSIRYAIRVVWSSCRGYALTIVFCALLGSLLAPVTVLVLGVLVTEINEVLTTGAKAPTSLDWWIVLVVSATFVALLVANIERYTRMRLKDVVDIHMENKVMRHAGMLDAAAFDDCETQDIIARVDHTPGMAVVNLFDGAVNVAATVVQLFTLGAVLFWVEPWLTFGLVAAIGPFFLAAYWASRVRHHYVRIKTSKRRWSRYYKRILTHRDWSKIIKLLSLSSLMNDRRESRVKELFADQQHVGRLELLLNTMASCVILTAIGGALLFASRRAIAGELNLGTFSAFWMAAWKFRLAAGKLGTSVNGIFNARLTLANLQEFFAVKPTLVDTGTLTPAIRGGIEFRNVSFRYSPNSPLVLANVSLTIAPGEVVALVGPNGAGKSTVAQLISRLYQPTSGGIFVDGIAVDDISLEHYYRSIAFVLQNPARFEATAAENIAFGDWTTLNNNPDRIRDVARTAGADEVINALPRGYDTFLGRVFGEHDLSGGQWKRIALAQALASEPRIVILDEPAANLDIKSESLIHAQLQKQIENRTTLLISHHFSTVQMADRIVVLVDGQVVEEGNHDDLLSKGGVYAAMYEAHCNLLGSDVAANVNHVAKDYQNDRHAA
jgi:ATP-binding cassette subfamily B protein